MTALGGLEHPERARAPRTASSARPVELRTERTAQPQQNLDLFDDQSRWPRRPSCTADFEHGTHHLPLLRALTRPYIQANPPHLRVWSIQDVDRANGAGAWEEAYLPPPTWAAVNRQNGHAHLVWGLRAPVLVDGLAARDAPMRYLCAVESLMREKLEADAGFAGLITKNPAHPLWRVLRPASGIQVYDLADLAEWLPGIEKHLPRRRPNANQAVGLGRNVTLFDRLRAWSYRGVRRYWGGGLSGWNAWMSSCNVTALVMNGEFGNPLGGTEVWHIAKSVAKWTWRNFSSSGFSKAQAARGRLGGLSSAQARRDASEPARQEAQELARAGYSYRAIAAQVGVSVGTAYTWCRSVQ